MGLAGVVFRKSDYKLGKGNHQLGRSPFGQAKLKMTGQVTTVRTVALAKGKFVWKRVRQPLSCNGTIEVSLGRIRS